MPENDSRKIPTPPTRNIDFQVDTIPANRGINGVFNTSANTVDISYKDGSTKIDSLPHEQKHRDNYAAGMYAYAVSPEQAYKLNMHDEISANMASLLVLRQKYIETGDLSVFDYNGGDDRYAFYKQAIANGEIKPASPYQEDFDKEMAFIVNGTRDMWEKNFGNIYVEQNASHAKLGDESRKYAKYYDENYQRGMKIAYTIGGVDFTQYMDRDAEIPEAGKTELKWLAAKKCSNKDLAKEYGIPAYDGSMSLEQYQKLVQHKLTMDKFIENRPPWRDNAEEYLKDIAFDQMLYDNPGGAQYLSPEEVKTSVGENLERTKNSFNEAYKSIDQKLVAAAVETAAREYAEQGKELPPANDKAYNMAVDGIYTRNVKLKGDVNYEGAVCLRKTLGNEKMLNTKLPQEAEKVQNTSGWERTLYNYMTTVGIPKDEASGKAAAMAEENKVLGGFVTFVGAPVIGAWKKCKNMFSSDDEKVENKPINPVNKEAPKYRKWEDKDGSRVSEVQHVEILDLTAQAIQRPTTSYALLAQAEKQKQQQNGVAAAAKEKAVPVGENGDVGKAKMVRIIEYMNKINGSGKTVDAATTVDALCEKYGDKAQVLLMYAVNEPCKYAEYIGDKSIRTSRAALQHLCSLDGKQEEHVVKYAEAKSAGKEPPTALPQQKPQAAQEKPKQTANADNAHVAAESLKSGHNKVIAMRDKLRQGHIEQNDNTRVDSRSAAAERLRFEQAAQRHGNRQPITAEAMRKLMENRRVYQ